MKKIEKFEILPSIIDNLICPICLEILKKPLMEKKNQHLFCSDCLLKSLENNSICPLCKEELSDSDLTQCYLVENLLASIKISCEKHEKGCNWTGLASELPSHINSCTVIREEKKLILNKTVEEMKQILDLEINPHLEEAHLEIYKDHVRDWIWLLNEKRDWKWWWWCNNPWWGNVPCMQCNILWHKYEAELDGKENIRRSVL